MDAPYEYGSVMHYSVDQFALNPNRPVIYARDKKYAQAMGNRMRATFQDVSRMNNLYNCHGNNRYPKIGALTFEISRTLRKYREPLSTWWLPCSK